MSIDALYDIYLQNPSVQTDTRKIKPGDIFFALKGPNFNGNSFVQQALDMGAAFAVADEETGADSGKTMMVEDVLTTLQSLAKKHRESFSIPFIAITGSNGKTTTKELVHQVLTATYRCYTTEGNLNNHIGIPLTILKIRKDAEIAVIEMGANHIGEIASYCSYAMPTHGLITNCGKAHLEGFGSPEGVRIGKGELFDYLRLHEGTAFIYNDYDYLIEMSKGIPEVIKYGTSNAEVVGTAAPSKDFLKVQLASTDKPTTIHTQLIGNYNLPNVLAAVAIGRYFKIEDQRIKRSIEEYAPSNSRSQMLAKGSNRIILDAYNANPSSMKEAIENIAHMPGSDKILVLGAMKEMGAESEAEHAALIKLIQKYSWKAVALTGNEFSNIPGDYHHFETTDQTAAWFRQLNPQNSLILIKGSRSNKMEKILE